MKKEEELAATNKLLQIIRGESESLEDEGDEGIPLEESSYSLEDVRQKPPIKESTLESPQPEPENRQVTSEPIPYYPTEEPEHSQGAKFHDHLSNHELSREQQKKKENLLIKQQGQFNGAIKSLLGIDFGSRYIKFVQVQSQFHKLYLVAWGIIELPSAPPFSEDKPRIKVDHFKGLLDGLSSSSKIKIITSIGGPSVIVRHIKFPPLSNKEIAESVKWEAKSYIPFPLREVNIDYQILGRSSKDKQVDVLLVAVTKKLLSEHLDRLHSLQISPQTVDINSLALVNANSSGTQEKEERAVVLLDIGASTTILNIYKKNDLYFTRDILIAGDIFTKQIQKEKNLSFTEAEQKKIDRQIPLEIIKPALDNLIKEIRRSLIYYDNQTSHRGFGRVVLSGGSCRFPGLDDYLSEELGLSVEIADPFLSIYKEANIFPNGELEYYAPFLSLATGLIYR